MHTARTHKMQMMTQNWYTIFRESQTYGGFAKHVQAYCIDGECSVLEALQFLRSSKRTFFFVEKENGTIECFTDRMLYEVMHENPAAVIADILKNKQKKNTLMP